MNSLNLPKYLPVIILLFTVLLWGCKQPETVVINDAPTVIAPPDTTEIPDDEYTDFRKLVIGEYHPITSFDPLLADNSTTRRALQLLYEGLVRLDANGNVVPAAAKSWEISNDSLTYTFILHRNSNYHDSDVFSTGTGRRLVAKDVKFVFERMAKAGNPPAAAKLFWAIKGFEPFFQEQRKVYESQKRTLSGVTGIQAKNDSTIIFELYEKDSKFLKKLATPYALIYPREAVNPTQNDFAAVGTGPFFLSSQPSDSTFVFTKSQKYRNADHIRLNRVDILTSSSKIKLMHQIGTGDIHLLPELGPNMMKQVVTLAGTLKSEFKNRLTLTKRAHANEYVIRSNPDANLSHTDAESISHIAYTNTSSYFGQLPSPIISPVSLNAEQVSSPADITLNTNSLHTVYSDDPFVRTYLGMLSDQLKQQNVQLGMTQFRIPTRTTELWITTHAPLISSFGNNLDSNFPAIFRFRVYPTALLRNEITGLNFNQYGWWISLSGVSLPATE